MYLLKLFLNANVLNIAGTRPPYQALRNGPHRLSVLSLALGTCCGNVVEHYEHLAHVCVRNNHHSHRRILPQHRVNTATIGPKINTYIIPNDRETWIDPKVDGHSSFIRTLYEQRNLHANLNDHANF